MSAARDTAVIQRARDWLSFASPREPGWVLIRDLAAEIDNLTLQNESCGNALVDSEAENARIRDALERALHRLTHVDGKVLLAIYDAQVILREALAGDTE